MSKRIERFCDFTESLTKEGPYGGTAQCHPKMRVNKDGACIEAAVGQCIRCKRDFCDEHKALFSHLKLELGSYCHVWKIPVCEFCGGDSITGKFKLSEEQKKMAEQLIKSISQSFALIGKAKRAPKATMSFHSKAKVKQASKSEPDTSPEEKLLRAIFGETLFTSLGPIHNEVNGVKLRDTIFTLLSDSHFTEREVKVIRMRFGFDDSLGKSQTLDQVKIPFDVTRERIRQIEGKALRKLRHPIRTRQLKPYLQLSEPLHLRKP
jgi:hypothetical protein